MIIQVIVLLTLTIIGVTRIRSATSAAHGKRRAPRFERTRALRLLLGGGLLLLAAGQLLSFPLITRQISTALTPGAGKVAYNIATAAGLFLLIRFFVHSTVRRGRRNPSATGHGLAFTSVSIFMIVIMAATPPALRNHSLQSPFITVPQVASFYIAGNAYFIYAYVSCGVRAWRYAADGVKRITPLMRISLRVTAAAALGLTLTSIGRAVWVLAKFARADAPEWFDWINWQIANLSFLLLAAGLSLLVAADGARAIHHYRLRMRQHRRIGPLWRELRRAYPEVVMPGWWLRGRFHRRVVECLDGLTRLRPHIAAVAGDGDLSHCDAAELAGYLRAALDRKLTREAPDHETATADLLILRERDPEAVVAQLAALATAFGEHRAQRQPA